MLLAGYRKVTAYQISLVGLHKTDATFPTSGFGGLESKLEIRRPAGPWLCHSASVDHCRRLSKYEHRQPSVTRSRLLSSGVLVRDAFRVSIY